ncbi:putative tyrosine decarboxylase [Aspergillus rambellii]|uniref:Putative tyrosine decarboxylase n=1 Tax=Aspergillus rambellii TaxID=308745 RepID=A0A0F8XCN3_9EURO|nr:putative tyrosine decarboxylase [Aspergillus rambellii]
MNTNTQRTAEEHGELQRKLWEVFQSPKSTVLPDAQSLAKARASLPTSLQASGVGFESARRHILEDLVPAFNNSSISSNYYGFVTGGVTPAALFADNIVSAYDQNVQVHLPDHSVATDVEYVTLGLLVDLLQLGRDWQNGTFTTGATASNILGLACGREYILRTALKEKGTAAIESVGESGLFETMQAAGLSGIQILSTMPHSSLVKAAGVLGIGRANVKDVSQDNDPLRFNLELLETELQRPGKATIVAVSCGEVNTGQFATGGAEEMQALRSMCDKYGAWLHVDGAFGIFGRILAQIPEFSVTAKGCEGIELADSLTADGHKLLNVPYDCGFFLCRHKDEAVKVFQNANAAYLTGGSQAQSIPSPLNIGIENSRRFRALPAYASLVAYGRTGYQMMLQRHIRLARMIAEWLFEHPKYNVLPEVGNKQELLDRTYVVVLFSAKDDELNRQLAAKINETRKIFVSGTSWQGRPACRIAISNWRADDSNFATVRQVLDGVAGTEENRVP